MDTNQVLLVTLDGRTCDVQRRVVGGWTFVRQAFELNAMDDVDALGAWLEARPSKPRTVVKLSLRGALNLAESARLDEVLDHHRLTFASLNTWERHTDLVVAPDGADLEALDVSGYVRDALDDLVAAVQRGGSETGVAEDALRLLYRLAR